MNLPYIFNAVRRFGIKGIFDYFLRKPREHAFNKSIKTTLRSGLPERGITLISCFDFPGSLSKVMRDFAIMLKQANIPYQTLNMPCKTPIPDSETKSFLTPKEEFCANKFSQIVTMRFPLKTPDERCKVHSIEFWEFEDGFVESCPEALQAQNVLALSDFNRTVFRKILPASIGVRKVLYPFQFRHGPLSSRKATRQKYGIGESDFVVFFNFDYTSSYFRKNPEGILHAFARALKDHADAKIVFKTMRAKKCKTMSDRLHYITNELGLSSKLITIDNFIPQEDLVNLTNSCDVYMSLHRGEGFGLGIAEAMSLGKPVIVTDYSSTTEFCNKDNSIPIPYHLVPTRRDQLDVAEYHHVSKWAEPDIDQAAAALLRLYNNPAEREAIGRRAKEFIDQYFSVENFKRSIDAFLSQSEG